MTLTNIIDRVESANTPDIETIVKGLSEAMREALIGAEEGWKGRLGLNCRRLYPATIVGLETRGLIDRGYYLTDLGKSVRSHISERAGL